MGLRSLGGSFRFDPAGLLIGAGDEVHWLNMGDFHTVTSFHPDYANLLPTAVPLRMPREAAPFHSGMLGLTAGTQFTHRFEIEGVYDYFCQPHYSFGMVGRIVVGGARGGPALTGSDTDLIEAARSSLPTVDEITGRRGVTFEWAARANGILYEIANGRDGAGAAEGVATGAERDEELRATLPDEDWDGLKRGLSELVAEVNGAFDYELLVQRVDDVKAILRRSSNGA